MRRVLGEMRQQAPAQQVVLASRRMAPHGRMQYVLEEQDLMHPNLHAPRQGNWDGLKRFLR
jgi:hypothetical protein